MCLIGSWFAYEFLSYGEKIFGEVWRPWPSTLDYQNRIGSSSSPSEHFVPQLKNCPRGIPEIPCSQEWDGQMAEQLKYTMPPVTAAAGK